MQSLGLTLILVAWIILSLALVLFAATRKTLPTKDETKEGKYPQGYFLSIGMGIGIALGILVGLALGSVSGGIAIGIGFGLIIGQSLEKRFNSNARPFTEQENKNA